MPQKIATIFGGTGFIGRYIVRELARMDYIVKVVSRVPERAFFLRPCGKVGQIVPMGCNFNDQNSIDSVIQGSDIVINCIGILYQRRRRDFIRAHIDIPGRIAHACARLGTERFVHISALGSGHSKSRYARSKRDGEQTVLKAFPQATILRPSVVFGPEDDFFNMFAGMARLLPVLPLIGGGRTKFQPVYVADIAASIVAAIVLPVIGSQSPGGKIYELGGPEIMTIKDIYERIFAWTGRRSLLMPLPFWLAKIEAAFIQFIPPKPLLTPDQVTLLQTDSVVSPEALGFEDLGIRPTGPELIVPAYLERFRPGGRFSDRKPA
jgi:NADH dehydrogenase